MSSNTQTRGQIVARYERLKKRMEIVKVSDDMSKSLIGVAKTTIEMFPVTATAPATTVSMPSWDDAEAFMKSLAPSPSEVFTEDFFKRPLFPVVTLHDVAKFYGCPPIPEVIIESLGLSPQERENKNIKIHIWFADFLECDRDMILDVVRSYKSHRGSSSTTRPFPVSPVPRIEAQMTRDVTVPDQNRGPQRDARSEIPIPSGSRVVRDQTITQGVNNRNSPDVAAHDTNDSRKATNVFQYFKDSKFTGDIKQSIELTIRDYNVCARQHKLTPKQKADFFVNVLADPARTFFFNNARDDMTFEQMADMMVKEYNSDARQLQVQGMLETLRLDKYMAEHDISSHSEGLTKLVDVIERLTPQCQPQFRSDANKINYLRKAVLGFNWSMTPIGNIITAKYTFNGFVTALREHLQLESEVSLANPLGGSRRVPPESTFHQQYGRNPKFVRKHGPPGSRQKSWNKPRATSSTFEESRRKGICHMCKQKWHPGHRCKSGFIHGYVRDRFKKGDSAVHIVSDLVLGLEGEANEVDDGSTSSAGEADGNEEQIQFGEVQDDLSLYDQLTSDELPNAVNFIETADKEWFTNHLSTATADGDSTPNQNVPQDF